MNRFLSLFAPDRLDFKKPSVLVLIAANLVPLLGVLFLGWSTFAIVVVYWAENVIIGMINVLKMLTCSPSFDTLRQSLASASQLKGNSQQVNRLLEEQIKKMPVANHASKLFFIPFFIFHYGLFCFVHGMFIFELLGGGVPFEAAIGGPFDFIRYVLSKFQEEHLLWAVLALTASHLYSFVSNYIMRGEYRQTTVLQLMFQPYVRIVILHVSILLGAFLTMALGSPVWMLVILIAGKTLLDITLHLAQRYPLHLQTDPPNVLSTKETA